MYSIEHSILDYKITDDDLKLFNPYLKKIKSLIDSNSSLNREDLASLLIEQRNDLVSEYCFTIPYYGILKKVSAYSPIVEAGAGSGYWARCLVEFGADVVAYDRFPPDVKSPWDWRSGNSWFDDSWYHITGGDESAAAGHPDRALFMAWPMPMNPMAYNALVKYKNAGGRTLIYIGDPHPASSGDEHFYSELLKHREVERIDLYGWPGINEKLIIYSLV
ncbi:MAG TPA: hypothetical protein PK514_15320 [Spirochaetota bacterium]|nr:hypothetical protein [Spirochaetota bacterium]